MMQRRLIATTFLCVVAMQALGAQDWEPRRRWRHRDGVQIRVGRDYHLPADQIASWPVIVIGGSATIDGRVEDDLVVIGGPVRIGPGAQVRANVVALGGPVQVADGAEVSGEIRDVDVVWPELAFALRDWMWRIDDTWWAALMVAGTLFRFTLTLIAACLVALVAPGWVRRIAARAADAPIASGVVGVASQLLIVPLFLAVAAVLIVTIVGIPLLLLLPFVGLALLVSWLAGFAAVAAHLGRLVRGRSGLVPAEPPVVDVAWGVTVLFLVTAIGNILALGPWFFGPLAAAFGVAGFVIEYLVWTVGLGAALLAPFGRRWEVTPPPVPAPISANA